MVLQRVANSPSRKGHVGSSPTLTAKQVGDLGSNPSRGVEGHQGRPSVLSLYGAAAARRPFIVYEESMIEFREFQKIARLSREIVVTEKIDGTNACLYIPDDGSPLIKPGSRSRWISVDDDNFGFAKWVKAHGDELMQLGPGLHYGEWWGQGIQRKYGQTEKHFSLFNTSRWTMDTVPSCCRVVPTLYRGDFNTEAIDDCLTRLRMTGSVAAPGFMDPEGIVIYHTHGNVYFKKTIKNDELPKSQVKA
jgi:RNA ligase